MIAARLEGFGDSEAVRRGERSHRYRDVAARASETERWAARVGLAPGSVVALEADFTGEGLATMLGLWAHGCAVLPVVGRIDPRRAEIAQVEAVVSADPRETLLRTTGRRADHPLYASLRDKGEAGLVLFTSGTTGTPRAVVHEASRLLRKLDRAGRRHRTAAFLGFDHVGGLNTALYCLMNGGTLVGMPDRSPRAVWETIGRAQIELLPATPTFLRLLALSGVLAEPPPPSLRLISYGAEPMPPSTLATLRTALPDVEFLQQYGMSELGVLRSRSREDGSTWVRLGGPEFEWRVVDGLLEVRAETAMLGYLNAPSPFTSDGWLRTGDLVERDGEWLRILGRQVEVVNVGGEKVHPAEVEEVLESMEGVAEAVVRGEAHPITGQILVASVRLLRDEPLAEFRRRMRRHLAPRLPAYKTPHKVEIRIEAPPETAKKRRVSMETA